MDQEIKSAEEKVIEALTTLENAVAPFDAARPALNSMSRFFESGASVVAWQVAVVSPGFLGLLWNARTLAQHSRLDYRVFNVTFVGAELCFLGPIMSAMVLHNFLSEKALIVSVVSTTLEGIQSAFKGAKARPHNPQQFLQQFKSLVETHDSVKPSLGNIPKRVTVAGKLHGKLAVIGYVLLGVIVITTKLHN